MGELRIAVITCSNACHAGEAQDDAGRVLIAACTARGWDVLAYDVVPLDLEAVAASIVEATDVGGAQVVLTLGGIGLAPCDVTPEATLLTCDRQVPGIAEVLRAEGLGRSPRAMFSRGVAALCGDALVINLPGAADDFEPLLPVLFAQLEEAVAAAGADA